MDGTNERRGGLRDALLMVALEMVDEGGAAAVSVREAARRAGVSPGAPFRHFTDREALLQSVAELIAIDFVDALHRAVAEAEGSSFRAVGFGVVRYALTHPHRFEMLRSAMHGRPRSEALHAAEAEFEGFLTELIVNDQKAGELGAHDPATIRTAGQALVYGLAGMIIDGNFAGDGADGLVEEVLDILGTGIGPGTA